MTIGIKIGPVINEVGAPSFLNSLFSTVTGLLENNIRGSRFPVFSVNLYEGHVSHEKIQILITEMQEIRRAMSNFPPSKIIWDIDDLNAKPPWGNGISKDIISLENYFVTSTGRDLFNLIDEILAFAKKTNMDLDVVSY